jgi:hypothetical protein
MRRTQLDIGSKPAAALTAASSSVVKRIPIT